jgi:nitrate/nitrite-specific signal transduction histidine kinase
MYGMIRTIRQIGAGQWNAQVRLRDSDELQMIGRHLNEMSEQLIRVSLEDLTKLDQISSAIANLEMDANGKEALNAKVAALKSDITKRIGPMKDRSENHD